MKLVYSSTMFLSAIFGLNRTRVKPLAVSNRTADSGVNSIYEISLKSIDGKSINLGQYKGKKILIVNTASKCGFAPQMEELQKLHELHGDKLVVLGFPSEDFGGQEYDNDASIGEFCIRNYGVSFQLFAKSSVSGENSNQLFKWLTNKDENGWNDKCPNWNYCKFLINEKGELEKCFTSAVSPLSEQVMSSL